MVKIGGLYSELRRRRVLRMIAAYVIASWVAVQIISLVFPAFHINESAIRYAWLAVLLCFPLALVFSWKYDITAQGIKRTAAPGFDVSADLSLKKRDYVYLILLLAVAAAGLFELTQRTVQMELEPEPAYMTRGIHENSIAVLPLENLSGDDKEDYFAAGMHDALITSLSQISALRVTSRLSTLRVDKTLTMPEVGQALKVARIIEGSVMKAGNRVRIIVQLIDAASDEHLWAHTYQRTMDDIMDLQGEIAKTVARSIGARIMPDEEKRLVDYSDVSPEVYEAYLRGMYFIHKETSKGYRKGIEILAGALEHDPDNALAHAGVAYGYAMLGHNAAPQSGLYPKAKTAALKALELDDRLPEAHLAMGMFRMYFEWDWTAARKALERAIELNPSLVSAHYHYAWLLELLGESDKAIAAGIRTRELSPISAFYASYLGVQYRQAGRHDEALEEALGVLEMNPNYPVAIVLRGDLFADQGDFESAIEWQRKVSKSTYWRMGLGIVYAKAGMEAEAREIAESIEAVPRNSYSLANIYMALGDREESIRWLEAAYDYRLPFLPWLLAWHKEGEVYWDDPRVQQLIDRTGLRPVIEART